MPDKNEKLDSRLAEGIAYFEQMLKIMPGDRTTLEFLSVAYGQTGDADKCRQTLIALARTLLKEGDLDAADTIAERLEAYPDADAKVMALKVRAAHGPTPDLTPETPSALPPAVTAASVSEYLRTAALAESAFIRVLASRHVVTEEQAAAVQKHLAELPETDHPFLVSALSILDREDPVAAEKALSFVADSAGTPPIPTESFPVPPALLKKLPQLLVRVRGVIPFAQLGDTVLVALLNPLDDDLCHEIEVCLAARCRFYLSEPKALETVLDKLFADKPSEITS